ncbi:hypothetical protein SNE40_006557 [Patella caerulea]|uniref:Uncharacterized protein n=2 Tax=Patella caerulea TaxID=87958 RepID=A0AAN8JXT9_PATCE
MADQEDSCSICLDIFTEPKTVDCGHTFCRNCLENYYVKKHSESKTFPCPICQHDVEVPEGGIQMFPSTNSKKRKIEQESAASVSGIQSVPSTSSSTEGETIVDGVTAKTDKIFSCDACKSSDNDIYKCIECYKYMCFSCKNTRHDAFNADHHVFMVFNQDTETRGRIRQCIEHTKEKMEFYCKKCSVAICKTCRAPDHQDHEVLGICDYRDEAEAEFKKLKDELELKSPEFEKYVGEVSAKIDSMEKSAQTSCSEIDRHVKEICDVVTQRANNLKEDLKKTLQEDKQMMEKIVGGTADLIGRMAKMSQNISDILIGDCMYDMTEILTIMKRQRDEWKSRDLARLHVVKSKHHTAPIDLKSVNDMVGEFRVTRQANTTLKHRFNYDVMNNKKENEWVYSPVCRLEDLSLYFRAKFQSKGTNNLDLGLFVNCGDNVNKSTINYCTVRATMTLCDWYNGKMEGKEETKTLIQTFTQPFGILNWNHTLKYISWSWPTECTLSATVEITMTTVL